MGLIHTPRVFGAIGRGLWKRRQKLGVDTDLNRLGIDRKHVYKAKVGVWDYALGHMNNASYLNHAEYCRWDLAAQNGMLGGLHKVGGAFIVGGCSIRYRRDQTFHARVCH